ncbi:MAG: hypothetical protein HEP71_34300 [Roseivirga sp.]|nr:hypothetical protein [Roseivirga sp.]
MLRLSGIEAKKMAREGVEYKTNYSYENGALRQLYKMYVETGQINLPSFSSVQKKLRDSYKTDPKLLKIIIEFCYDDGRIVGKID